MKTRNLLITITLTLAGLLSIAAGSDKTAPSKVAKPAAISGSQATAAFEKLKGLEGEWEGKGHGGGKARLRYEVVADGTAVLEHYNETSDKGASDKMVTMFYIDGGHLVLTHYCSAKNQPHMAAKRFDAATGTLDFNFVSATNLPDMNAGHVHSIEIQFVDHDHMKMGGEFMVKMQASAVESNLFTRVK